MMSGKRGGRPWIIHIHGVDEGGGARTKEFLSPSCNMTVTFEKQCQYSSLFGRFDADQRKV